MITRMLADFLQAVVAQYSSLFFFFQAEDGIRDLVRSRGLGDVYKRQALYSLMACVPQNTKMQRDKTRR